MPIDLKHRPMTFQQLEVKFPDEDCCKAYLAESRWHGHVSCPRCGNDQVHELQSKPFHWECSVCASGHSYRFSVLVGTIFENTNYPLTIWFKVIFLMLSSKKGMSALQIQRMLGMGSYRTAWSMCHKVRAALGSVEFQKLTGFVEVDETFVGGKAKNKHKDKRGGRGGTGGGGPRGGVGSGKAVVAGAVQRKGNVVARVVANVDGPSLLGFIRNSVSTQVSLVCTDSWRSYKSLGKEFPHGVIDHRKGEYVMGAVHTNTIEGFWSMVKRGIIGTYHKVSHKYLSLYVNEFEFRYNNRKNIDIFGAAIRAC